MTVTADCNSAESVQNDLESYSDAFQQAMKEVQREELDVKGPAQEEITKPWQEPVDSAAMFNSLCSLEAALEDLPQGTRAAYDEAMKRDPHLVELETPKERFLRILNFNHWAAAEAIASYWTKRVELFEDRAFRPLTIDGYGALSRSTAHSAQCGGFRFMGSDKSGRPVLFVDRSKFCCGCNHPGERVKVMFYFQHLMLLESQVTNEHGYVMMMVMDSPENSEFKDFPPPKKSFLQHIRHDRPFPFEAKAMHLIFLKKGRFFEESIPMWFRLIDRSKICQARTIAHVPDTPQDLLLGVESYGLGLENIIPDLNQEPDRHSLFQWYADRLVREADRYKDCESRLDGWCSDDMSSSSSEGDYEDCVSMCSASGADSNNSDGGDASE
uniref:CRAL-TRIO domain-containing protein n=1 Tax=Entomoneis paludosa TaxID=265537 RepID=A0A7S2YEW3_9STRA|mmetsp:Transcript_29980/g.62648  ORF Transcript_29980/g.62648 Transcript_29980/m.62648 type:complete len:384 (+) Transcript_29980:101-1252(+)